MPRSIFAGNRGKSVRGEAQDLRRRAESAPRRLAGSRQRRRGAGDASELPRRASAAPRPLADELQSSESDVRRLEAQRPYVVLLVDDDLRTTRRMADMLREDGFAVEIARDGAAAVARLSRSPVPDALVTELTTAHADGTGDRSLCPQSAAGHASAGPHRLPEFVPCRTPLPAGPPPLLFTKPVELCGFERRPSAIRCDADTRAEPGQVATRSKTRQSHLELESVADHARRNALSGAQTLRALRRP